MDIELIRSGFPAIEGYSWFQNGGVSITPKCVADAHPELMRELFERGPMHIVYPEEEYPRRQATMQRLASFFAVVPGELALMRGVSEAYQTVLRGINWHAGDEIMISQDEEAAILLPTLHLRDVYGVKVRKLPLLHDKDRQLTEFGNGLSERTKLVALSHVTTDLGWRLPIREICEVARERRILSFVDLAHSAGVFPIDLHDLSCDFAGILSYKWMYAPYASGLLYARAESQDSLVVRFAGGRSEKRLDFEHDRYDLRKNAERFQYGPWSWPLVHAWATAADWLCEIGLSAIAERTTALTRRLKERVKEIGLAQLFTPCQEEQSAAIVSFGVRDYSGETLSSILRQEWNMIVKPLPHTREGLRISVPFFLYEDEIDRLADAVTALAKSRNA